MWKSFFDKSQISMETLRTSVYFDTSIENAYLKGSFIVGDDLQIIGEKKLPKLGDIVSQGYKFFKGEVTYSGCVNYNGKDRITLEIGGIYMVANVYINGVRVDYVFENAKEITKHLKLGENSVYITLKSSLRNLLGPHHHAGDADLTIVSPYHFIRRGEWVDGIPKGWSDEYKCVQFGLEKVEIIIHK